jgi:hypothetical protein
MWSALDARSFSTMAAACQREMNVSFMVVATTTRSITRGLPALAIHAVSADAVESLHGNVKQNVELEP